MTTAGGSIFDRFMLVPQPAVRVRPREYRPRVQPLQRLPCRPVAAGAVSGLLAEAATSDARAVAEFQANASRLRSGFNR